MPVAFDAIELQRIQAEGSIQDLKAYAVAVSPWLNEQYKGFLKPLGDDVTSVILNSTGATNEIWNLYDVRDFAHLLADASALISRVVSQIEELHRLEVTALSAALAAHMAMAQATHQYELAELEDRHDSFARQASGIETSVIRHGAESQLRSAELEIQQGVLAEEATRSEKRKVSQQKLLELDIQVQQRISNQMAVSGSGYNYAERYNVLREIMAQDFQEAYLKAYAAHVGINSVFGPGLTSEYGRKKFPPQGRPSKSSARQFLPAFPTMEHGALSNVYAFYQWITEVMRSLDFIRGKEVPFSMVIRLAGNDYAGNGTLPVPKLVTTMNSFFESGRLSFSLSESFDQFAWVRLESLALTLGPFYPPVFESGIPDWVRAQLTQPDYRVRRALIRPPVQRLQTGNHVRELTCEKMEIFDVVRASHDHAGLGWVSVAPYRNIDPRPGVWEVEVSRDLVLVHPETNAISRSALGSESFRHHILREGLLLHLRGWGLRKDV